MMPRIVTRPEWNSNVARCVIHTRSRALSARMVHADMQRPSMTTHLRSLRINSAACVNTPSPPPPLYVTTHVRVVQRSAAWTGMEYSYPKVPTTAPMRTAKTYARMRISSPLMNLHALYHEIRKKQFMCGTSTCRNHMSHAQFFWYNEKHQPWLQQRQKAPPQRCKKQAPMEPLTLPSLRGLKRCVAAPACISARPDLTASTTSFGRYSTTRATKPWVGLRTISR